MELVWTPTPEEMYLPGFQTWVTVDGLTRRLEGEARPTHFRGVTTIVAKLFNAVGPDKAYFGQKDAQQAAVIRQMVKDLNFPIEIVVCPIVREPDGLAMSSRNVYLNPEERQAATVLFRSLSAARSAYDSGERQAESLRALVREMVASRAAGAPAICLLCGLRYAGGVGNGQRKGAALDGGLFGEDPADR